MEINDGGATVTEFASEDESCEHDDTESDDSDQEPDCINEKERQNGSDTEQGEIVDQSERLMVKSSDEDHSGESSPEMSPCTAKRLRRKACCESLESRL